MATVCDNSKASVEEDAKFSLISGLSYDLFGSRGDGSTMAERKTMAPLPTTGQMVAASEVPIEESTERWTEVKLEDGTVFRIKPTVLSATRLEGHYDQEGNPFYLIKNAPVIALVQVPDHLRDPKVRKGN